MRLLLRTALVVGGGVYRHEFILGDPNDEGISTSIANPPGLSAQSSPFTDCAGVTGFVKLMGSEVIAVVKAKGAVVSFGSSSSSLGVSSRAGSSVLASSGYRPRSEAALGVRGVSGRSEHAATIRWN